MRSFLAGLAALPLAALAQQDDAVVVTATRVAQPSLEIPASIDRVYAEELREGRPQVNLSESLGRVPGLVVLNRQNYAQDLQISSRGFGARASFGVRGIRLISDNIPATMPDGQGQSATFDLGSASRVEVLRGPFSAMYGNASGGVINVFTEDPPPQPTLEVGAYAGSYDTWRAAAKFGIQHYTWLCINPKEAEDVGLAREVISIIPEFMSKPNVLGIGEFSDGHLFVLKELLNDVSMDKLQTRAGAANIQTDITIIAKHIRSLPLFQPLFAP